MRVYNNILETIGNTPLVKINKLNKGEAEIYAKIEYFNPSGSIKDRTALSLIEEAQKRGEITPNLSTIIEPTSGNTGIGLAMVCSIMNYKLILTMPETMSKERQDILRAYGAEIVLTKGEDGMLGAIKKAQSLKEQIPNSFIAQQFDNPDNIKAHYNKTAQEIYDDTDGKVDIVIAGVGTGGTISGIGKKLKELKPEIKIIAYEPATSPMITKGISAPHKIQGIGANFVPKNYLSDLIDEVITIEDEDAIFYTKELAQKEGLFCGISSGGAMYCANEIAKRDENKNKTIVTIFPDSGMKYLSSNIF